jgi:hypothetical protein
MKIHPVAASCSMRKDGRTDRQTDKTKLIVSFRSFANEPKNSVPTSQWTLYSKETYVLWQESYRSTITWSAVEPFITSYRNIDNDSILNCYIILSQLLSPVRIQGVMASIIRAETCYNAMLSSDFPQCFQKSTWIVMQVRSRPIRSTFFFYYSLHYSLIHWFVRREWICRWCPKTKINKFTNLYLQFSLPPFKESQHACYGFGLTCINLLKNVFLLTFIWSLFRHFFMELFSGLIIISIKVS